MVKVKEDMTGWVMSEHGVPNSRLTVVKRADDHVQTNGIHRARYLCKCQCGNEVIARGDIIKSGKIKSCGCLQIEWTINMGHRNKKYNTYDLSKEYGIGLTSNTSKEFYFDLEDYDKIKNYCWCESISCGTSRLATWKDDRTIFMHQLLGFHGWDHINRNGLDNRKNNLRACTHKENTTNRSLMSTNTSGFIGVSWCKTTNNWKAQIMIDYKGIHLGCFDNKEDAIKARLNAELKYYGPEFAPQRHLFEQYGINTKTTMNIGDENNDR
jgi:hypothetical protein